MPEQPTPRPAGLRLATIAGVPVFLGWSWLLLAGLILLLFGPGLADRFGSLGYLLAALYAVALLVCVLAHEAAHAVIARWRGYPVIRVVADLWGGHTAFDATRGTPASMALIAIAGPAANLALGGVAGAIWTIVPEGGAVAAVVGMFAWVNLLLAVFNLLPGLPLDGGQVVESAVWGVTRDQGRARVAAGWAGRVLVILIAAAVLVPALLRGGSPNLTALIWGTMVAAFLWAGATSAINAGKGLQVLGRIDLAALIEPAVAIPDTTPVARLLGATAVPVVVDDRGRPLGLIDNDALRGVPADRIESTPVGAVTTHLPAGWSATADGPTPALDLVRAFQTSGSPIVAVIDDRGDRPAVRGIVRADRVNAALRR